jgi:hypothetical protein
MTATMKSARKTKPAPQRGRPPRFGGDRQIVGARLPPETYQRLIDASVANRTSLSAEIEVRLARSFEDDPAKPGNDLMHRAMEAFEGAWLSPTPADEDWMKDPLAYHGGMIRAFEALLAQHPDPRFEWFLLLLTAVRSRLEERLLAIDPDGDRKLPGVDWETRRAPKPDTKEKGDNWLNRRRTSTPNPDPKKDED